MKKPCARCGHECGEREGITTRAGEWLCPPCWCDENEITKD